jgi:hypothetical protein
LAALPKVWVDLLGGAIRGYKLPELEIK